MSINESLEYDELVSLYKETIIIRLRGMFYNAFEESAFVLSVITGYKVKRTSSTAMSKCGYPSTAFEKVLALLKKEHINYVIYEGKAIVEKECFKDNRFLSVLHEFDDSTIDLIGESRKQIDQKSVKIATAPADTTQITFSCPKQIIQEAEALYKEYMKFFGNAGYSMDMFISTLLLKGVREYKKENL